jgi:hypothetical protein
MAKHHANRSYKLGPKPSSRGCSYASIDHWDVVPKGTDANYGHYLHTVDWLSFLQLDDISDAKESNNRHASR